MQLGVFEKTMQYAIHVRRQISGTQGQKMGWATHAASWDAKL